MMDRRRMLQAVLGSLVAAFIGVALTPTAADAAPLGTSTARSVTGESVSDLPIVQVHRCRVRVQRRVCTHGRCTYVWRWIWVRC